MKYNTAYHVHCELTLDSGRVILLEELRQRLTYGGLLEGVPCPSSNDREVENALREAREGWMDLGQPILVSAERRDYLRVPGDMDEVCALNGGAPEWLPMICCMGLFRAWLPARNPEMDGSRLITVWYQDEFGPPAARVVLKRLKTIDWDSSATDFEY